VETVGVGVGSVDHVSRVGVGSVGSQEYPVDVGMSLGKGILEIISVSSFLMQGSVAVQSPHVQSTVTLQLSPASRIPVAVRIDYCTEKIYIAWEITKAGDISGRCWCWC
jgi:hypothetical protein